MLVIAQQSLKYIDLKKNKKNLTPYYFFLNLRCLYLI